MPTLVLLRHGRSTANNSGILAGRSPGVALDERGQTQAEQVAEQLAQIPLHAVLHSPMLRCEQTVAPLAKRTGVAPAVEESFAEVDYGEWTGAKLAELSGRPEWSVVQNHPSAARFPGGEGLADTQYRAVSAVRRHNAALAERHGEHVVWLACSHGDVIKAILADALGMHLDCFQRLMVDPASVSVISYTRQRPFVLRMNERMHTVASGGTEALSGAALAAALAPPEPSPEDHGDAAAAAEGSSSASSEPRPDSGAIVGGGAGV